MKEEYRPEWIYSLRLVLFSAGKLCLCWSLLSEGILQSLSCSKRLSLLISTACGSIFKISGNETNLYTNFCPITFLMMFCKYKEGARKISISEEPSTAHIRAGGTASLLSYAGCFLGLQMLITLGLFQDLSLLSQGVHSWLLMVSNKTTITWWQRPAGGLFDFCFLWSSLGTFSFQ